MLTDEEKQALMLAAQRVERSPEAFLGTVGDLLHKYMLKTAKRMERLQGENRAERAVILVELGDV